MIDDPFWVVLRLYYLEYINSSIAKVNVKLDDEKTSKNSMLKDLHGSKYKVIPTQWLKQI